MERCDAVERRHSRVHGAGGRKQRRGGDGGHACVDTGSAERAVGWGAASIIERGAVLRSGVRAIAVASAVARAALTSAISTSAISTSAISTSAVSPSTISPTAVAAPAISPTAVAASTRGISDSAV